MMQKIIRIARIEWIKTWNYSTFKILILLHAILFLLISLISSNIQFNLQGINIFKIFHFPHIWNTLAWFASWFNLLLGVLAIVLVSNEFQFRTFRKQLIDGLSRDELLGGKVLVMTLVAAYAMLLVFLTGLIIGIIKTTNFTLTDLLNGLNYLPVLYIQALAYTLLALLFVFIFRTPGPSIIMYLLYFFPIEPIIRAIIPESAVRFMPAKIISKLTPMPDFVGISLSDMIEFNISGSDLFSQNISKSPSLTVTSLMVLLYCTLFVLISRQIIIRKNF
jgi:ABC-type transport system involved in multi-copper enzyme maturation permease subunit